MSENKTVVFIDPDLKDLIPGFLVNRKNDAQKLRAAVEAKDFARIDSIGHSLKGVGGGYGFHEISRLGAELESAAKQRSTDTVMQLINDLELYLNSIDVQYQ